MTEDHPLEYADFEAVIPEGVYGAGPVMVWDAGSCETSDGTPAEEQLKRGEIIFTLQGKNCRADSCWSTPAGVGAVHRKASVGC